MTITTAKSNKQDKFVLYISGDGGWNGFSQKIAESYAANGFNVVGLNSFKYFWKKKAPQQAADDIAALLKTYCNEWHKQKVVICGFSFGADVIPFIYTRLPDELKNRISLIQLISPSSYTDFEIHVIDMMRSGNTVRSMNIAAEVNRVDVPVICYYGQQEPDKPLAVLKKANIKTVILAGDHHYSNTYTEIIKNAL
ncbi:AcvB/VirJ family lysyl-phosphatidylglycerol hydrolase [Mucilaginibacter sp. L3T2-6]|uniref:AcvB/VirJ family lysyl-phosphatidylglycerol hydrolase n=1 Tax=Mucilaginibacter sp. L3T2-6 TaxID=3062491 RepID=UPI0026751F16|nr:AcvB/VirJ family lysyl-phosphatidylglycerol hydrolase [Mucilaginibacter sp. L3T2-6]